MVDLSPDLSVYHQDQMNPASLLSLIQSARQLQTQGGISEAIRANPDDPSAAYAAAARNPNVFMGPQDISSFVNAQRAKSELSQWYMGQATSALGGLVTKPNATLNDWHPIKLMLQRYGVPVDMLDQVEASARGPNGTLDHDSLVRLWNFTTANSGLPGQPPATVTGPYGTKSIPPGQALYNNQGGAAGTAPPPPRTQSSPVPGGTTAQQGPGADSASASTAETRRQFESGGYGASGGAVTNPPQSTFDALNAGAKQYNEANARDYRSDVTPMEKAIGILRQDPNLTGRGMDEFNNLKNFLHSLKLIPDADMKSVTNFEELKKYLAGFANSASMGGTDARMWQQIASSPSVEKLGSTNLDVARVILGLRRMQQVGLKEFERQQGANGQPLPSGYFSKWMSNWSLRQDPMAFVWDTMSKEEQYAYGKDHWTGKDANAELARFRDSRTAAQRTPGVTSDGQ